MQQDVLTPQKNSETIKFLWDSIFGKLYPNGLPRHTLMLLVKGHKPMDAVSNYNGRTYREKGKLVRVMERPTYGTLTIPGKSAIYFDGLRYDFYHGVTVGSVLTSTGQNVANVTFRPIKIERGMRVVNPQAEPELFMFLMLSMYNEDSPIYWKKEDQKQAGVSGKVAAVHTDIRPKFSFHDQMAHEQDEMGREIAIGTLIGKIGLMTPEDKELLYGKLGMSVPPHVEDVLTHMTYNLMQKVKSDPMKVQDAMGRMVPEQTVFERAIAEGIIYLDDRMWKCKSEDGNDRELWLEPDNPNLTYEQKKEMLVNHIEDNHPDVYAFYVSHAKGKHAKREATAKNNGVTREPRKRRALGSAV